MLIDKIKADQLQARKDRDAGLATLLTTFYSEAVMIGKNDGSRNTTDDEVAALAKKFIKNAEEVMDNLGDMDLRYESAGFEIGVLSKYIPIQLSEQELRVAIEAIIQDNGLSSPKDKGVVFKELKTGFNGLYDGRAAGQLINELLK